MSENERWKWLAERVALQQGVTVNEVNDQLVHDRRNQIWDKPDHRIVGVDSSLSVHNRYELAQLNCEMEEWLASIVGLSL